MEAKNVYDKARGVVRELQPLLHTIREEDKSLAEQLKRAAQSVVLNIAEALTARKPPGHRADFIERGVHRLDLRAREVPVRHAELKSRAHLLGRAARRREPRPRRPRIVSIGFRDVENDAIHRPVDLVEERPISLANNRKNLPQPPRRLKRPLLNDKSHE